MGVVRPSGTAFLATTSTRKKVAGKKKVSAQREVPEEESSRKWGTEETNSRTLDFGPVRRASSSREKGGEENRLKSPAERRGKGKRIRPKGNPAMPGTSKSGPRRSKNFSGKHQQRQR